MLFVVGVAATLLPVACTSGTDGSVPDPTTVGTNPIAAAPRALDRRLATVTEPAPGLPGFNVHRPADLGATGAPLPVVVWANGGCVRFDSPWNTILDTWAASGFVVVSITAPPGAEADPRAAGMSTAADQALAIDWAYARSDGGGAYAGHLDLGRVAAAGNSCGGVTSLTLASRDDRVTAAFVLSGSSAFPGSPVEAAAAVMGTIRAPVGFAIGGPEDISTAFANRDVELTPDGVAVYLARRSSADHREVSTDESKLEEVAQISTNWLDYAFYGNPDLEQVLLQDPCGTCAPGTWSTRSKDLVSLRRP